MKEFKKGTFQRAGFPAPQFDTALNKVSVRRDIHIQTNEISNYPNCNVHTYYHFTTILIFRINMQSRMEQKSSLLFAQISLDDKMCKLV